MLRKGFPDSNEAKRISIPALSRLKNLQQVPPTRTIHAPGGGICPESHAGRARWACLHLLSSVLRHLPQAHQAGARGDEIAVVAQLYQCRQLMLAGVRQCPVKRRRKFTGGVHHFT